MSHAPNPQHIPPAMSAEEYEREIERLKAAKDASDQRVTKVLVQLADAKEAIDRLERSHDNAEARLNERRTVTAELLSALCRSLQGEGDF